MPSYYFVRRTFLTITVVAALGGGLVPCLSTSSLAQTESSSDQSGIGATPHDRSAYYGAFRELPITSFAPTGWMKSFLETQRAGLGGHAEVAGYPFTTPGFATPLISACRAA